MGRFAGIQTLNCALSICHMPANQQPDLIQLPQVHPEAFL